MHRIADFVDPVRVVRQDKHLLRDANTGSQQGDGHGQEKLEESA
jgi:hypothetical protein